MTRGKLVPMEIRGKVLMLKSQGKTSRSISTQLGLGLRTVYSILHPGEKEKKRDRRRVTRLSTTVHGIHGIYKVHKRPRPDYCELCHRIAPPDKKILAWHHWDDDHLELGMWLCTKCHIVVGGIEEGIVEKYMNLKEKVTKGEMR